MKKQVLLFVLMLMPLMASAQIEIDGIWYNLNSTDKVAEVTHAPSWPSNYADCITIPKTVEFEGISYSVTAIGSIAFKGSNYLTSVTIPNSVTYIGGQVFEGCSSLVDVYYYAESMPIISSYAFYDTPLENITLHIPTSSLDNFMSTSPWCQFGRIKSIDEEPIVFSDETVKVLCLANWDTNKDGELSKNEAADVKDIGVVFRGNTEISSFDELRFFSGLTEIPDSAFYSCHSLTSIQIPISVKSIGNYAFWSIPISSMVIPNGVTNIGNYAFELSGLQSLNLPNSVTSIGEGAFRQCYGITSVRIPNNCQIGSEAFLLCENLVSIEIPNGVGVQERAFLGSGLTSIDIPDDWTGIPFGTFSDCSKLTSINIPNSVKTIGGYAFYKCLSLTSINIPNSVTSIGNFAFYGCDAVETIIIGSGVKFIGTDDPDVYYLWNGSGYSLPNSKNLKEVICLAKNVPSTGRGIFTSVSDCTLYVPESSLENYKSSNPWSRFGTIKSIKEPILFADKAVEALCVTNWDENNDGKFSMDEAAAVTDLGSVFANNTDITSFDELQYFTGLTSIGEQTFYYCSNLNSIIIPENVTTISNRAFYVCSSLKSLRIPANVSSVEDRALAYCSGLETINVDENNQYYDSRNNCNALIQTSSNMLLVGCKNSVIPDGVASIAEGAFRGCTELVNIVIPEGVKTIGASAFRGCTGLISVSLPSTITSIGNYAFSAFDEVYNLATVRVGMTSPVAIASEVFPNRANSILYVPKGSRPAYKAADYWKEFKQIVELENGAPLKCEKPIITLLANGKIKVESATEGATCVTNITASNAEPLTDGEISLNTPLTVYTVTSYATKEGYDDSEVATATFRYEKTEGDMNGDGTLNITDVIHLVNMILGQ